MKTYTFHTVLFILLLVTGGLAAQDPVKSNFLFIIVDDLNDFVVPFTNDQPQVQTPNIKKLADEGTVFMNAFSSGAGCAPSRTSFLCGKDIEYTRVYHNSDYSLDFRSNFNAFKENETVYTLPEVLKANGYFTFGINKIFHSATHNDFDETTESECDKQLSWNRTFSYDLPDSAGIPDIAFYPYAFDNNIYMGIIPDDMEELMTDYVAAEKASEFINDVATGTDAICGRPFMLTVGIKYPHNPRYLPASFMNDYYLDNLFEEPLSIPYNHPANSFPYNGVVMPPQPDSIYRDFYELPENGIGQAFANYDHFYEDADTYYDNLTIIPEIDPLLTDEEREQLIENIVRANYHLAYLSAIEYADQQIGKIIDALNAHPLLAANTIIVLMSDHGYALGEKRHWEKWCLWETDIRIPFIIADPSRSGGNAVHKAVSQLDLFPTICDLAGVDVPTFDDGSNYPDGKSLVPLMEDQSLNYALPAITSTGRMDGKGSCYPSYSVRDERFHYIIYRENNDGSFGTNYCDDSNFSFEEELYEIGVHRETDPHEWTNLVNNIDYQPVIRYLQQWLPDSNLYLQSTYRPVIQTNDLDCLLEQEDVVELSFDWFDSNGILTTPSPVFTYRWTDNLTDDVWYGTNIELPLSIIDETTFDTNEKLIVYLQVFDPENQLIAFDLKYLRINASNSPSASFYVLGAGTQTATISDFNISGVYNSYWWDFGLGPQFTNQIPGPFTFSEPGSYDITLYISYGNDCYTAIHNEFTTSVYDLPTEIAGFVTPNPANQYFVITGFSFEEGDIITIFDIAGKLIRELKTTPGKSITIQTTDFDEGSYVLRIKQQDKITTFPIIIIH